MNWLYVHLGIAGTGSYYGFWSGFGSDIAELSLAAGLYRSINCHEQGCWRLGHHYKGHVVCRKHRGSVDGSGTHVEA